jgi:molybdenum cofactor biosynthesis protein B
LPGPQHQSKTVSSVRCAVITVSDSRTPTTDESGSTIVGMLTSAGHTVASQEILPDEPALIRKLLLALCDSRRVDAVLITGGTGLAARDSTVEAVGELLEKRIDGFGELFRMLSFAEIGPAAMISRALGGVRGNVTVFVMPGSPAAVRLAMEQLILPELPHVTWLMRPFEPSDAS